MKAILILLALCLLSASVAAAAQHGGSIQTHATIFPGGETGNG